MIGVGTFRTTPRVRKYINQVLDSERLSYGPFTQKFERVFASAHDCRYGVMSNSGTCALMIAIAALKTRYGWADGDEVIVPAITFIATSNIVLQLNLKPIFVDVDPKFYELDPAKIEAAVTDRTRCIIPVHVFGHPCDMGPILEIAARRNLRVVEDSCETMFAKNNGRSVGSFGDVGCFSTYVAHILVTGVGGICTTNDPDLAVAMRSIMNHGRDAIYLSIDDDKNKSEQEKKIIIARRFRFVQMGYSFRVTELEGALGLAGFEDHEPMMQRRRLNGEFFTEKLTKFEKHIQLPSVRQDCNHSFMMFPIVMRNCRKDDIVEYLEQNGIETREMLPLVNQPFYQATLGIKEQDYPVAKWINENGFYIASHQDLSLTEREYIVRTFENYFNEKSIRAGKSALVVMSNLPEAAFDELKLQNFIEALPLQTFDELILAAGVPNTRLNKLFEQFGFRIISMRASKATVLAEAVDAAESEYIVVVGIDGTDNTSDISEMLIRLREGSEIALASRFMLGGRRADKGFITKRSFGNRLFALVTSMALGQNISDPNNLFRGFRKATFHQLKLSRKGDHVMYEMTVRAIRQGITVEEFPTTERPVLFTVAKHSRFVSAIQFCGILIKQIISKSSGSKLDLPK